MSNKDAFENTEVVQFYRELRGLQNPETAILARLEPTLPRMRMLDIGVGGGRTTPAFASLAAEYVGIDYSAAMIESCRQRFSSFGRNVSFGVCDVRDLRQFESGSFDFVLFSFNGIDYLAHDDRLQALAQMRRVLHPGGVLALSTHNLRALTERPPWPGLPLHPLALARAVSTYVCHMHRHLGFRRLRGQPHAVVKDGAHGGLVTTYYLLPEEQVRQLADAAFGNVRIFGQEGTEISEAGKLTEVRDAWLYFLCEAL